MGSQLDILAGSGIILTPDTNQKSVTIATDGSIPSTTDPLAVNKGGTGRTDLADQIAGLACCYYS